MMNKECAAQAIQYKNVDQLTPPAGHYSHYCKAGDFVFISGILPVNPQGIALVEASFEEQTQQVFHNLTACLNQDGLNQQALVQVRVYIANMNNWPSFNHLYAQWMGDKAKPARAVAGVKELHFGLLVEVEAIAFAPSIARSST